MDNLWNQFFNRAPFPGDVTPEWLPTVDVSETKICEEQLKECQNLQKRITVGNPSNEILSTIESEKIDLVIMGTHGRKGLDHAIFGSVAEKVMKKSPVPVLIINTFKDE